MKLTLYKKCILNNSYSEVFNCKKMTEKDGQQMSVLDVYLSNLEKFEYENEFIYTEGNGSFQIELYPLQNSDDIYSYNYLKVEEIEDNKTVFKRYCFIDSITKITSNVVNIQYSEDVWSSYSDTMEIRDGVICNKRRNPKVPYYLPAPFDGNNAPIFAGDISFQGGFIIVCQLQLYELKQDGTPNKRTVYTVALTTTEMIEYPKGSKFAPELFYSADILNIVVQGMANNVVRLVLGPDDIKQWQYEVDNFTLIPSAPEIIKQLGLFKVRGTLSVKDEYTQKTTSVTFLDLLDTYVYAYKEIKYYSSSIVHYNDDNFKNLSFGTLLSQYQITPNGSDINYDITFRLSNYDFKVLLYIQNKIIDITNDLVVKMPFTSLNAEENTAKKIQRELTTINGVFDIVQGVSETGIEIAGAVMTGGMSLVGGSVTHSRDITRYNYSPKDRQLTSRIMDRTSARQYRVTPDDTVTGIRRIANGVVDVVYANKPKYSSTQGTFATSEGVINATAGFGRFVIKSDNDEYVKELIKRVGYTVFMSVKSYEEVFNTSLDLNYDIIKMTTVVLYGNFPQEITYQLTDILLNGVRVFNSANVEI